MENRDLFMRNTLSKTRGDHYPKKKPKLDLLLSRLGSSLPKMSALARRFGYLCFVSTQRSRLRLGTYGPAARNANSFCVLACSVTSVGIADWAETAFCPFYLNDGTCAERSAVAMEREGKLLNRAVHYGLMSLREIRRTA